MGLNHLTSSLYSHWPFHPSLPPRLTSAQAISSHQGWTPIYLTIIPQWYLWSHNWSVFSLRCMYIYGENYTEMLYTSSVWNRRNGKMRFLFIFQSIQLAKPGKLHGDTIQVGCSQRCDNILDYGFPCTRSGIPRTWSGATFRPLVGYTFSDSDSTRGYIEVHGSYLKAASSNVLCRFGLWTSHWSCRYGELGDAALITHGTAITSSLVGQFCMFIAADTLSTGRSSFK